MNTAATAKTARQELNALSLMDAPRGVVNMTQLYHNPGNWQWSFNT
jgi:hypothetical protein